jgi:hypothetical protein
MKESAGIALHRQPRRRGEMATRLSFAMQRAEVSRRGQGGCSVEFLTHGGILSVALPKQAMQSNELQDLLRSSPPGGENRTPCRAVTRGLAKLSQLAIRPRLQIPSSRSTSDRIGIEFEACG